MNKKQLEQVLRALETFDRAAQAHGWHEDQGSATTAFRAKRLYKAAKTRLRNLLKDVATSPTAKNISDSTEPS